MKKKMLKGLSAALTAGTLLLSLAGFTAGAEKIGGADENVLLQPDDQYYGDCCVLEADMPTPETNRIVISDHDTAPVKAVSGADSAFIERCRGNYRGYNDLADRTHGAGMQSVYRTLDSFALSIWDSDKDITKYNEVQATLTNENGESFTSYYKVILNIKDESETNFTTTEAGNAWFCFRRDNPLFYFYGVSVVKYSDGGIGIFLADDSYLTASVRKEIQNAIKDYVTNSQSYVKLDYTRTDYQNALSLYNKVMDEMTYEYGENGKPSASASAHNIVGGIMYGKGVCESYAKIYNLLLNYYEIDNLLITGKGIQGSRAENHAWNMLVLDDGNYYYADPTWDDKGSDNANSGAHKYFATGTGAFNSKHRADSSSETVNHFIFRLPEVPYENFDPTKDYRSVNPRLVDFDLNGKVNNSDLKSLQKKIVASKEYSAPLDINNDGKVNNRDLKAMQRIVAGYTAK